MKIKRCTMIALVLLMIISNVYAEPTATPIPTTDPTATTDPIVTSDPTITLNPTATSDPTITSDPSASPDTTETPKPTAEIAEYIIEFRSYDENTKVYTADVYLDTKECLSAGTFGMQYDASIMPKFELDPMFMEHLNFPNNGQNYLVFQWGVSPQTEEPDPGVTPDPEATADPDATWEPEATLKPTEEPDPDATPEPTAIPGSIVTPGPTARPGPTWTPGPTARPGPTLTPGPTARPDPTLTPGPTARPGPTLTPGPTARPEPTSDENTIWSSDVKKVMTGKLHFGTITIENVELNTSGKPLNWHDKTLRQLNWYITPESKEDMYTFTDGITCLNDEIYNKETGFYQGWDVAEGFYNPDWDGEPRWVDIGFVWNSGYDLPTKTNKSISVFVNSYNPKNSVEFKLYDKDNKEAQIENVIPTEMADPATGKVKGSYELEVNVPDGAYTLEIKKDVHLTYKMEVTVSEEERAAQSVTLYCGDISGDEKIKLNDRTALLNRLNKQNAVNPDRCDLNGDGKVTQFDLSIMKLYYNKSY